MKISAVVITYNERENIRRCLESIKWVDEIIVIDSGSSDGTYEIAKEYAKVITHPWLGYAKQKNFGISLTKNEWILSIDADEELTPSLKEEILQELDKSSYDGYYFPRQSFFLDKWIKYSGWYPDYQLRLFKKSKGRFNEKSVHEKVIIEGKVKYLKNHLLHYPYKSLEDYFKKFNEYTSLSSEEDYKKGKKFNIFYPILIPFLFFLKSYVLKKGFLDGRAGFIISSLGAINYFVRYAKLWEKYRLRNSIKY
jgi:glycosyltransferase involved in cell wall biosynthesis